jgi:hypothetical protein
VKPNDKNGNLPAERPFRVLIIAGSDRRQYTLINALASMISLLPDEKG